MQDFYLELAIRQTRIKKKFFECLKIISKIMLLLSFCILFFMYWPKTNGEPWQASHLAVALIFPAVFFWLIIHLSNRVIKRMDAKLNSIFLK